MTRDQTCYLLVYGMMLLPSEPPGQGKRSVLKGADMEFQRLVKGSKRADAEQLALLVTAEVLLSLTLKDEKDHVKKGKSHCRCESMNEIPCDS